MSWPVHRVVAAPIEPRTDSEIVEVLPAATGDRLEERRLRRQLAAAPNDAALAVAAAKRYLTAAHASGDPRQAGRALAALDAWPDDATAPDEVLLTRANLQQYVHEFDASVATLQRLLARPNSPPRPQAWLTLATVRRVQGRYAESDAGCQRVIEAGSAVHGQACLAENQGLRGRFDAARTRFESLIATSRDQPTVRAWLLTSLAELEQRAMRPVAAEAAFRAARALDQDSYLAIAHADWLLEQDRPADALAALKGQARSDPVLLRLAIAGAWTRSAAAAADIAEMRERIALANERPDARVSHGREQAMFALAIDGDPAAALALARGNAANQREPLDLLVLAQAAKASGDAAAIGEARRLAKDIGLVDRRIDALL